jgi:hypothetical protein
MIITIIINDATKVSELKKIFNNQFPFLKIEFFKKSHKKLQGSLKKNIISDDFTIKSHDHTNVITYSDDMSVADLEKQFSDNLKLSVQIFRKSGRTWLETTFTDNWSLKKQNQEGMELSQL